MHDRSAASSPRVFPGDSEMARRMRAADWSVTSMGPVKNWPENLCAALSICLVSRFPMQIWWGPELFLFYNDACIPFIGPDMLGRSGREAWAPVWDAIGPMAEQARKGSAGNAEDVLVFTSLRQPREEAYLTFSFCPMLGQDGKVDGLYCVCSDTTVKVIDERRLETLSRLGQLGEGDAAGACRQAVGVIARNPRDIPLAAIYLVDDDGHTARLAAHCGLDGGALQLPPTLVAGETAANDALQLGLLLAQREPAQLDLGAAGLFDAQAWPLGARTALVLPLCLPVCAGSDGVLYGLLMAGVGERRPLDAEYRSFLTLVSERIAGVIATARSAGRPLGECTPEMARLSGEFVQDAAAGGQAPQLHILVADEDSEARSQLLALLEPYGEVKAVAEGPAVLEALDGGRYDVLFAAMALPGLDTPGLLRRMRSNPAWRLTPVVLMSEQERSAGRSEALRAGADDYLAKPFGAHEIAGRIASCLALMRLRAEAMAESELSFRAVQQASPDAFLIFAAVRDASGKLAAFDCQFANPATTRVLGKVACARITGRNDEGLNQLFATLAGVMETDRPWHGEHPYQHHGNTRWLRSMASRAGDRLALSCADITSHHGAEVAMRQSETRQSFLLALSDNLRPLCCPRRIMEVACEALGRQLKVAAVAYAEIQADGETLVDSASYGDGRLPGLPGLSCRLSELSPAFRRALVDGRARFVPDLRRAAIERAGRAGGIYGRGVRATAVAPLIKDGKLVACLYAADAAPRSWTGQDRNLLREIADRTWSAVERARAEQALAGELNSMARLHEMSSRMVKAKDLNTLLLEVLDATIELHGAFAGIIQLLDEQTSSLRIAAHRGFAPDFVREFGDISTEDHTLCARAMASGRRMIVEDVEQMTGSAELYAVARRGGFRAIQCTPLVSHGGQLLGMLNTHFRYPRHFTEQELRLTDLCARHAADAIGGHLREQMQMRTSELLESRVLERTAELQQALDALNREVLERQQAEDRLRQSEKLKAIGQLTGGIAHDFNNMLQTISSGLNLVRLRVQQGKVGEVEGYLRRAEKGAQRAAALTHRLLAFSRQQTLEPKSVSLGRIAREMEDMVRRAVGPSVQVDLQLSAGKWLVMCDPNQMESALLNMCVNARDAMPNGGWLTIGTDEIELDSIQAAGIEGASAGRYATISVADSGHGMSPEVLAHVFEPFFTTKPLGKGTGLGLSQIYGFVQQSGGFVQIESTLGKGTTVRVALPYNAADPDVHEPATPDKGQTLLLVEDEQDVREMTGEQLREMGYRVLEADSGPAALRLVQAGPHIDLMITDVGLPGGMDGHQVVGAVRERMPVLPVIMISGYAAGSTSADTDMLRKPFLVSDLVEKVKAKLEARHP